MSSSSHPLIAIVGPTGSGKSALALWLAEAVGCAAEILNCDSVQVYQGLEIGSAKTPVAERRGVPHHLLDIIPPAKELTAGDYSRLAAETLQDLRARSVLPLLVGGTGFYLRALIDGLSPAPARIPELRVRLANVAQRRPAALRRFLRTKDGAAAERIHANDHQKLMRAIEMAGAVPAARRGLEGFRVLKLGLNPPRDLLYQRLNQRCAAMFANGLLEETRALLESGVPPEGKALSALGYKQAVAALKHGVSVPDALTECQMRTRHYAKRQWTWFRGEAGVVWLDGFGDEARLQERALGLVRPFVRHTEN